LDESRIERWPGSAIATDKIRWPAAAADDGALGGFLDLGIEWNEQVGGMNVRTGYFAQRSTAKITRNRL
jgi:hypothetical protein